MQREATVTTRNFLGDRAHRGRGANRETTVALGESAPLYAHLDEALVDGFEHAVIGIELRPQRHHFVVDVAPDGFDEQAIFVGGQKFTIAFHCAFLLLGEAALIEGGWQRHLPVLVAGNRE